jgi:ABC-type glutathione transport system ATPase component
MTPVLLTADNVSAGFARRDVVHEVSLNVSAGETVGLVGESGSGKTTLARALLRLLPLSQGRVLWGDTDVSSLTERQLRPHRRDVRVIFQNPVASLDPRMRIGDSIAEPWRAVHPRYDAAELRARVLSLLQQVGLDAAMATRYPHEFSGGQCQRIAIARAMITTPKLLVCDEPVSSLDVSIQGQIVNLLQDLQEQTGMAMIFISHNLAVVRQLSHRILVMHQGRIVESASAAALFEQPAHPYTRSLLGPRVS